MRRAFEITAFLIAFFGAFLIEDMRVFFGVLSMLWANNLYLLSRNL